MKISFKNYQELIKKEFVKCDNRKCLSIKPLKFANIRYLNNISKNKERFLCYECIRNLTDNKGYILNVLSKSKILN